MNINMNCNLKKYANTIQKHILALPCEIRIPRSVSKPTETPRPVSPSRPSRSNIGIQGQKSSEMWCRSSNRFLSPMMAISCRWLYSIGTYRQTFNYLNMTLNTKFFEIFLVVPCDSAIFGDTVPEQAVFQHW